VCASPGVHDTTAQENQLAAQRINPMAAGAQINGGGTSVPGITPGPVLTRGSGGKHGQGLLVIVIPGIPLTPTGHHRLRR
jgi:hypothetical protein